MPLTLSKNARGVNFAGWQLVFPGLPGMHESSLCKEPAMKSNSIRYYFLCCATTMAKLKASCVSDSGFGAEPLGSGGYAGVDPS
jgi:hypothetical protein